MMSLGEELHDFEKRLSSAIGKHVDIVTYGYRLVNGRETLVIHLKECVGRSVIVENLKHEFPKALIEH